MTALIAAIAWVWLPANAGDRNPQGQQARPVLVRADRAEELTGKVVDRATGGALEGAWVFATYNELRTDGFNTSIDCVKTRGMMTGPDGTFHFPIEKRDGMSPSNVTAIKPDYFLYRRERATRDERKERGAERSSKVVIVLERQDPKSPKIYNNSEAFCDWAKQADDTAAADRYIEIWIGELKKYGGTPDQIAGLERVIRQHKALGGK